VHRQYRWCWKRLLPPESLSQRELAFLLVASIEAVVIVSASFAAEPQQGKQRAWNCKVEVVPRERLVMVGVKEAGTTPGRRGVQEQEQPRLLLTRAEAASAALATTVTVAFASVFSAADGSNTHNDSRARCAVPDAQRAQ